MSGYWCRRKISHSGILKRTMRPWSHTYNCYVRRVRFGGSMLPSQSYGQPASDEAGRVARRTIRGNRFLPVPVVDVSSGTTIAEIA